VAAAEDFASDKDGGKAETVVQDWDAALAVVPVELDVVPAEVPAELAGAPVGDLVRAETSELPEVSGPNRGF